MELRQLRYFCKIAELEHFGRAARSLRIAQPALSRHVKQLEVELGVELFERLPRGVRLTAAGRQLATDAQRFLIDAENMAERVRSFNSGEIGKIRIGVAESASSRGKMVNILNRFRTEFPKVTVEIQHMTSLAQLEALTERRIDAAFLYHCPEDRTELMRLFAERTAVLLALPSDHRLADAGQVYLSDLVAEPMVWIRRSTAPATYDKLMRAWIGAGVSPLVVQETTSEALSLGLVSVGGLLSFVTDTNMERCPGNVTLRKVEDLDVEFILELVWLRADRSPLLKRFIETAENTI